MKINLHWKHIIYAGIAASVLYGSMDYLNGNMAGLGINMSLFSLYTTILLITNHDTYST